MSISKIGSPPAKKEFGLIGEPLGTILLLGYGLSGVGLEIEMAASSGLSASSIVN